MTATKPLHDARSAAAAFGERFGREPTVVVRAPGRVALLGAHVDYNDGWVMPAAIDRAVWIAAAPAAADGRIAALDFDAEASLDPTDLAPPRRERRGEADSWLDVPAGIAWAWAREPDLPPVPPIDAVFGGDLPRGAGVSSSAAVEVAFLLAWRHLSAPRLGAVPDPIRLAVLGRRAENGYLAVGSGVMDPFASLHGRRDHVIFLDCRHLDFEHLAVPASTRVVVFDSGVRRRLAESDFNDRGEQCREALEILRRHVPHVEALRDLDEETLELHAHRLEPTLRRRVQHVVHECRRVRDGAAALRRGDLRAFGAAIRRSHASSRDLYEVSIPELDTLCAAAWSVPGCLGARFMGGGFGGCVAALLCADQLAGKEGNEGNEDDEDDEGDGEARLIETVSAAFDEAYGRTPESFVSRLADGAAVVAEAEWR